MIESMCSVVEIIRTWNSLLMLCVAYAELPAVAKQGSCIISCLLLGELQRQKRTLLM